MPITTPTLAEIEADIISKIETAFAITLPALPQRSFLRSYATVLAGALWLLYKYGQRIMRNLLPPTADGDQLDYFGELFGSDLLRIKAQQFIGTITFDRVSGTTGDVVIPAGTQLKNATGATYYTISETTILDGNPDATGSIQSSDTGSIAIIVASGTLTVQTTIANLEPEATIATVIQQAADAETDADYRVRLVERFSLRPQGGSKSDYIAWAKTVSGVTRVFPYDNGFSSAEIYFLRDNDGTDNGDRIPSSTELDEVEDAIDTAGRLPIGDFLWVIAPTERLFRLTITSSTTLTQSVKDRLRAVAVLYFNSRVMYVDVHVSDVNCNLISIGALLAVLVQVAPSITDVDIDEVGGASGITTLELDRGDVAFLDSTASITFVVT